MRRFCFLLFAAALPLFPPALFAREADLTARGGEYTLKLALIGAGDEFVSWWGHLAVIVEDARDRSAVFFDYGVFSFKNEHFYRNLIRGEWIYRITAQDARGDIDWYIKDNRDITCYTLNLDAARKEYIVSFLNWNALPKNSRYRYNIFTDNCVSRVAFLLDAALDGRFLKHFAGEPGEMTVREEANRHLYRAPALYWILNLLMGPDIDKPPSKLAEMFLPEEFVKNALDFEYENALGELVPLVSSVEIVHKSRGRPAAPASPPRAAAPALFAGLALAALFGLCAARAQLSARRGARLVFGAIQALWALFLGLCGTLLFYMTFFSAHTYSFHNINVLFVNPLTLAAVPASVLYAASASARRVSLSARILTLVWALQLAGALLCAALKVSARFFQDNTIIILVIAPAAAALSLAGLLLQRAVALPC
jgi:hypothetical protein